MEKGQLSQQPSAQAGKRTYSLASTPDNYHAAPAALTSPLVNALELNVDMSLVATGVGNMTKAQQLAMVVSDILPRIQSEVDSLKAKGNESASIERITRDIDLLQVICGNVKHDSID